MSGANFGRRYVVPSAIQPTVTAARFPKLFQNAFANPAQKIALSKAEGRKRITSTNQQTGLDIDYTNMYWAIGISAGVFLLIVMMRGQ